MSERYPVPCQWTGDSFVPCSGFAKRADEQFVIGERYPLVVEEQRSTKTHNHEFAWLKEAWETLPEHLADEYPTAEHLRKRALIFAGYFDEQVIDAGSRAAALRVASAIRLREEFSHIVTRGPIVVVRTAKSQSRRAMDREEFQASKTALMNVVADLLGVEPGKFREAA